MKLNNKDRIIIDDDIIVTTPHNLGDSLKDVLDKQQKDIDKLQSNVKFIYSYGGIGGTGHGGSGGGGSNKEPKLYAELKNDSTGETKVLSFDVGNDKAIVFNEPGKYTFYAKLSYSEGKKFYIKVSANNMSTNTGTRKVLSTEDNNCEYSTEFNLISNGYINLSLQNSDGDIIHNISQRYIVNAHEFDVNFMYKSNGISNLFDSSNEYFLGDDSKDPYINIKYAINIPQVSDIKISYSVGDFYKSEEMPFEDYNNQNEPLEVYLKSLHKNDEDFLQNKNLGVYKVSVTFSYVSLEYGARSMTKTFEISIIPSSLFITVKPSTNVLYDTLEEIENEIKANKIPDRTITPGYYLTLYSKVYDGKIGAQYQSYNIDFKAYDYNKDSGEYLLVLSDSESVSEQREGNRGISFRFNSVGIKKLVLSTTSPKPGSGRYTVEKYIYVKDFDNSFSWPNLTSLDFYYKSNDNPVYSPCFQNILGDTYYEQSFAKENIELWDINWVECLNESNDITTVISFGIQYSEINTEGSGILEIYDKEGDVIYNLYSNSLFGGINSDKNKIDIPTEEYDAVDSKKYHLLQICRCRMEDRVYCDYLYIDGKLESAKSGSNDMPAIISKIVLKNVNISYNLINLQYYHTYPGFNLDAIIYKYWLTYKRRYIGDNNISTSETTLLELFESGSVKFDGKNVIVEETVVKNIAANIDIPTMMFECFLNENESLDDFELALFKGYDPKKEEKNLFGNRTIDLYWCGGKKNKANAALNKIYAPQYGGLEGYWECSFQGTSTMANRIKNFTLRLVTRNSTDDNILLFSPNFKKDDSATFLPEKEWTIKADIADSAHANNTAVGKFVNRVCSKFDTKLSSLTKAKDYVKNTLEGFPILMFLKCDSRVYYLGVYNFNLGRGSYYNLGYNTDIDVVYKNATESTSDDFSYSYAKSIMNTNLVVGEIQENMAQFDFSQTDYDLLFGGKTKIGTGARMFGLDSNITAVVPENAKKTLQEFVSGVAKAGAFCFKNVGKKFISPMYDINSDRFKNTYLEKNCVPDPSKLLTYDDRGNAMWIDGDIDPNSTTSDFLLKLIGNRTIDGETNNPLLDFASASEYYVICIALGLVDSIIKNMNIKSWDGHKCYIAYYDMDCAFGEDNEGVETVSYMAATDFWHSEIKNGMLQEVEIDYDYWDANRGGKGYDFTSSYLFAVIKYAKPICDRIEDLKNLDFKNYPQEFWAQLRKEDGELQNADYFINTYFKSGVHMIPEYLTSLNYKVKYLYQDEKETYNSKADSFNGTRLVKVRRWLNKRLHFLDMVFNVSGLNKTIISGMPMPSPITNVSKNPDVVILQDAFSDTEMNKSVTNCEGIRVSIIAPSNTPLIIAKGATQANMYILSAKTGEDNNIIIDTTQTTVTRFFGSKEFIKISNICPFLTSYNSIVSDKLENAIFTSGPTSEQNKEFNIYSTSMKDIKLTMPTYRGKLNLTDGKNKLYGTSITSIDISGSGFYGEFSGLNNLKYLNISSVKNSNESIYVYGNKNLTAENFKISGLNQNSLTTLKGLTINDVFGNFDISNTSIRVMSITGVKDVNGVPVTNMVINGDTTLTELTLKDMKSINIINCPNLEKLTITGSCEKLSIDMSNYFHHKDFTPRLKYIASDKESNDDGVFDLTTPTFDNLERLNLIALPELVELRLPNKKVKIGELSKNENLAVITTRGINSELVITGPNTFKECMSYNMKNDNSYNSTENASYDNSAYTKISIDDSCEDLTGTFELSAPKTPKDFLTIYDAIRFIETIVDKKSGNIKSLSRCFYNRNRIQYDATGSSDCPNLSKYTSLDDISYMYYGTCVNYLDSYILSLPGGEEYNNVDNHLKWDGFTKKGECWVVNDFLKNISYRIDRFYDLRMTIYEKDNADNPIKLKTDEEKPFKVLDLFYPRKDEEDNYVQFSNIKSFSSISFDSSHYLDFRGLFNAFNEIESIENFLNCDLSRFTLSGLLYPLKKLRAITSSFTSQGADNKPVDLWEFFDWENNTKDITNLFSSNDDSSISFSLNKTVSYGNFVNIMDCITTYPNITKLTNIFSNCKITEYGKGENGGEEIAFEEGTVLDKIKNINYLFYGASSDRSDGGLNISRLLHSQLPNVERMRSSFAGVKFTHMFTLDFFARRSKNPTQEFVYIYTGSDEDDSSYERCIYNKYTYNRNLVDLNNTFNNTRFVSCNTWYDYSNDETPVESNYISDEIGNKLTDVKEYYTCDDISFYTISYRDKQSKINCGGGYISIVGVNSKYEDLVGKIIYVKKSSEKRRYDGFIKNGEDYTQVFNISESSFSSIFSYCEKDENNYAMFNIIRYNRGTYTKHILSTPEIDDIYNNFTHYIKTIKLESTNREGMNRTIDPAFMNHDLVREYAVFSGKEKIDESSGDYPAIDKISNFVFSYNNNDIYPTRCMLPPDMLYACSGLNCDLTGTFSDCGVMGVIPRHFTSKVGEKNLTSTLRNTNALPNVWYYYNDDIMKVEDIDVLFEEIPEVEFDDYTITNDGGTEVDITVTKDSPCWVLYRDENGYLKKRKPNNFDKPKAQYVYAPSGYSSSINIQDTFNFRFNIPTNVNFKRPSILAENKPVKGFINEQDMISKGGLDDFHVEYFLMLDTSADWKRVTDARHPFIQDGNDIDFINGQSRSYYRELSSDFVNAWTKSTNLKDISGWYENARSTFNSRLGLCGTIDKYSSCVNDNGCPIVLNNSVKIDSFLSGHLVTFLCGRVFSKSIDVSSMTNASNKVGGSYVIQIPSMTKNIILPSFGSSLIDKDFRLINGNGERNTELNLYMFMFNDEISDTDSSVYNYIHEFTENKNQVYLSCQPNAYKYLFIE